MLNDALYLAMYANKGGGGGEQPQLNAPTISVSSSGNQSVISITNPSTNGNFVEKYGVYLDDVWSFDTTSTSNIPITTLGNHSVTVKACGTDFEDSPASNAVTVNNYTITVTCVDCTADVSNPTYISNNGATATLIFTPGMDLEIRSDSIVISGASVVSVDKLAGTVTIGAAMANIDMAVTASLPLPAAILTITGLGNQDPTSVVFTEEGTAFDWNFPEVTIDGNTFIKIPTMYRKVNTVVDNQITSFSLADKKVGNDYYPYSCFLDSDGTSVLPYVLIGKYCSSSTSEMNSVDATYASQTLINGRTNARALGTGYQLYDWQIQKLFVDLALLKSKKVNFNSGGTGITEYLGVKHLNAYTGIDGVIFDYDGSTNHEHHWYICNDPAKYSSDNNPISSDYILLSYGMLFGGNTSNSQIISLGYDPLNPFANYPTETNNSGLYNQYYCDQFGYSYLSGPNNLLQIGVNIGYTNNTAGLFNIAARYGVSQATNVSVRLCYKPISV